MFRYLLSVVVVVGLVVGPGAVEADVPAGPRLALIVSHPFPHAGSEVATVGLDGAAPLRLSGGSGLESVGPLVEGRPSWSADGGLLAFVGIAGGGPPTVFTVHADGTRLRPLRESRRILFQGPPVMAPDGGSVAVFRMDVVSGHFERSGTGSAGDQPLRVRTAIWSLDTDGRGLRPLTPWSQSRVLFPSSYSPDGSTLGATEVRFHPDIGPRAVAIDLDSGRTVVLASHARGPVYASDGRFAAVRSHIGKGKPPLEAEKVESSDLLVGTPGQRPAKVLSMRHGFSWPSWDPSAQRISFTTLAGGQYGIPGLGRSGSVKQVNSDGSCLSTLLRPGRDFFGGAAWQPGPGRGAGRIAC